MKIYRCLTVDIHSGEILFEDSYSYDGPVMLCDRSAAGQAGAAANAAKGTANTYGGRATQEYGSLLPGLEREANTPIGYTPTEQNNMLVAGEQGAGGANSGITGQANLTAGRTRNASGYGAALDQAARQKGSQLSENALNVSNKSAELGEQKQQGAQRALQGLYGTDTSGMLGAMGLIPQDVNAEANADKTGWVQDLTSIGNMLANGAKAASGAAGAGG